MQQKTKRSHNEKLKRILDNIANLEPKRYTELYDHINSTNEWGDVGKGTTYLRRHFNFANTRRSNKRYWIDRGWNYEYAEKQAKHYIIKFGLRSPFSIEFWLDKINPETQTKYTPVEAEIKRNSQRPICSDYWVAKGYTNDDAIKKAKLVKQENGKKGSLRSKQASSKERRERSCRCEEFWVARGYTKEEAMHKINRIQAESWKSHTPSERNDRITRWQETLNNKPEEEISRINKAKMANGYCISKNEKSLFETLLPLFPSLDTQLTLKTDERRYIYDIHAKNKIIEYNGDFWHANPAVYDETFINKRSKKSISEIHESDAKKLDFARSKGYNVLVIWEHDFKLNKEETLSKCIQFLKQ